MGLEGHFEDGEVRVGGDARQRFHDARGYGYPLDGNEIALAPVEAAHLLFRGDLDTIRDGDRSLDFRSFASLEPSEDFGIRFLVYADLRGRGFYLAPAKEPWLTKGINERVSEAVDFVVFPRGKGVDDGEIAYRIHVIGERETVPAVSLESGVLAVVDEESEITYFELEQANPTGSTTTDLPTDLDATLLADRVVVWNPPSRLYERAFYGQPLEGRTHLAELGAVQCSLLEATALADQGVIDLDAESVLERGRTVEGRRFDRRLMVYETLRNRGLVAKTGYKFGADFRTYAAVESVSNLGHSELLIRVHPETAVFEPRDLALDVRLSHGVRKTMVYAIVGDGCGVNTIARDSVGGDSEVTANDERVSADGEIEPSAITWWSIGRLTP